MKNLLVSLLAICTVNASAQKDKTIAWNVPLRVEGFITVTTKSKPLEQSFYEGFSIIPKLAQPLRFVVWSNYNYNIQIQTKKKVFVNETTSNERTYTISLANTDTINVFFITQLRGNAKADFSYAYTIGDTTYMADTAQLQIDRDPQKAFEQLLKIASKKFANLYPGNTISYRQKDIEFPMGLFAPKRAYKDTYGVTQYTGIHQTDGAAADKDVALWNKKIKGWLKAFKVSDIKTFNKEQLRAKSDFLNDEITEYRKINAQGVVLFVVSVFKRLDEGVNYYTGVNIYYR